MKTLLSTFAACLALVSLACGQDHVIENLRPTGDLTPLRNAVGIIPLARGGTGATTAAGARTALGTTDAGNITTGILDPLRLPGPLGATAYTVPDRLSADHTGWKVGDIVDQAGSIGTAGSFEISINSDVPNDGNDYGLGLYLSDANAAGGGSAYVVISYEQQPASADLVASDLADTINQQCSFASATASGNTVYVNNSNSGAVLFSPYSDDAGEGNQIDASVIVDTTGVDLTVPGTFLVTDDDSLGSDLGYTGLGNAFLSGGGPPSPTLGTLGNGYIDVNSGEYYQLSDTGWDDILNLKGPPGTNGTNGVNGLDGRTPLSSTQISKLALLQFWKNTQTTSYPVSYPCAVCFDGNNIWVNQTNGGVREYALNGSVVGTYSLPGGHRANCFDGTNVWITSGNSVTKLLASNGSVVGNYPVGTNAVSICFDGTNIWTANYSSSNITKLLASTGGLVGTYTLPGYPISVCFDGSSVWVLHSNGRTLSEFSASTGALVNSVSLQSGTNTIISVTTPQAICFDGTYIWVANLSGHTVYKVLASSASLVGEYPVSNASDTVTSVCYDGRDIWVGCTGATSGSQVVGLAPRTGTLTGVVYPLSQLSGGLCFDGTNLWFTNLSNGGSLFRAPLN